MKILSGSANPSLAKKIAADLNLELLNISTTKFPNGEQHLRIIDDPKEDAVVLIQTISPPVDHYIIETILLINALENLGVTQIHLVIPWMGYSIQNTAFLKGEPASAQAIAQLFQRKSIVSVTLLDLHRSSIAENFSTHGHELSAVPLFADFAKKKFQLNPEQWLVTAPDSGGEHLAHDLARLLEIPQATLQKERDRYSGEVEVHSLDTKVKSKNVILLDDGILTGRTIQKAATLLRQNGARHVYCFATHGVFAPGAARYFDKAQLDLLCITNSIHHQKLPIAAKILDCSTLFSGYIKAKFMN
jgi:ribose-phosphate pyrophosphokinase